MIGIWVYTILKTAADTYGLIWGRDETVLSIIIRIFKGGKLND
jgi:hypothetical protein